MIENETGQNENTNIPNRKSKAFYTLGITGRASRKTYWKQIIINMLGMIIISVIFGVCMGIYSPETIEQLSAGEGTGVFNIFTGLISVGFCILSGMVAIRRMHDFGCSGWLILTIFIPFIGGLTWIVFGCIPSEAKANKYGSEPDVIK